MAAKIQLRSIGDPATCFLYIESEAGASIAFGFDQGTGTFNMNTSGTPNVIPSEATSYFAMDPASGEVVIQAELGELLTLNSAIKTTESVSFNYTAIDGGVTPTYVALDTDYYISVANGGASIELPVTTTTGRVFIVKDNNGNASFSPITVTTVGGGTTIDGHATFPINQNLQAAQFIFNGTGYEVI